MSCDVIILSHDKSVHLFSVSTCLRDIILMLVTHSHWLATCYSVSKEDVNIMHSFIFSCILNTARTGLSNTFTMKVFSKNPYLRTKKLRIFEAEIFCYALSKQEPSPA